MKTTIKFRPLALTLVLPLTLLVGIGSAPLQAQPGKAPATKGNPPKRGGAVKHAEDVLGKPLTPAQKTAVRAAQKQRAQAMKPIAEKYRSTVAKALGLTLAQYEAREKALRQKNHQ